MPAMAPTQRHKSSPPKAKKGVNIADILKARLGWKPSLAPFPMHPNVNYRCGSCGKVKSGNNFDSAVVTPGRAPLGCRDCGNNVKSAAWRGHETRSGNPRRW
jgi:hypothetical protein